MAADDMTYPKFPSVVHARNMDLDYRAGVLAEWDKVVAAHEAARESARFLAKLRVKFPAREA